MRNNSDLAYVYGTQARITRTEPIPISLVQSRWLLVALLSEPGRRFDVLVRDHAKVLVSPLLASYCPISGGCSTSSTAIATATWLELRRTLPTGIPDEVLSGFVSFCSTPGGFRSHFVFREICIGSHLIKLATAPHYEKLHALFSEDTFFKNKNNKIRIFLCYLIIFGFCCEAEARRVHGVCRAANSLVLISFCCH